MPAVSITVQIGGSVTEFVLVRTNAPKAYDHGAALELYDGTHTPAGKLCPVIERYVLVEAGSLEWQRQRNRSGLHTCETEDLLLDAGDLQKALWGRLYGERP